MTDPIAAQRNRSRQKFLDAVAAARKADRAVTRAQEHLAVVEADVVAAMRAAQAAGLGVTELADMAGVSRQFLYRTAERVERAAKG